MSLHVPPNNQRQINLALAAGWMQYHGLQKIQEEHIMHDPSLHALDKMEGWIQEAAAKEGATLTTENGDLQNQHGYLLGRVLAVRLRGEDSEVGPWAVAAMICDDGGEQMAGGAVLVSSQQARGLAEDIAKSLTLPRAQRRNAVRAAMTKWESRSPVKMRYLYRKRPIGQRIRIWARNTLKMTDRE